MNICFSLHVYVSVYVYVVVDFYVIVRKCENEFICICMHAFECSFFFKTLKKLTLKVYRWQFLKIEIFLNIYHKLHILVVSQKP